MIWLLIIIRWNLRSGRRDLIREGGGGDYFPLFTEGVGAFSGLGRVGRGLIRTIALTRKQMASLKVRLKEPYLEV